MLLSSIEVSGLAGAPRRRWADLGRLAILPSDASGVAACDAVAIVRAAIDKAACASIIARRDLGSSLEITEADGRPEQVAGFDPGAVRAWLDPSGDRRVRVGLTCELDPPLFGRLRLLAARDPRLALALGQAPTLSLVVGWMFTGELSIASVALSRIHVGGTAFPVGGAEKVAWLPGLLAEVARRLGELAPDARPPEARLFEAMLSDDSAARAQYHQAAHALTQPPFSLPPLELVHRGGQVAAAFGPDLVRARQLGPVAARALALVVAVYLDAPDVLVVPTDPTPDVRDWLGAATEGDNATLEQVMVLGASE